MGVLDEAIRQHIELKRRHGASEQELQRKEEEALGPTRREAPAGASDADETPVEDVVAAAPEPLSEPAETPFSEQETRVFAPADGSDGPAPADEPDVEPRDDAPAPARFDDWLEPEVDPEPEPAPGPVTDVEADEPEDVLEETPEFLQETPEHDRLWFEQKPPRDFDFDDDR